MRQELANRASPHCGSECVVLQVPCPEISRSAELTFQTPTSDGGSSEYAPCSMPENMAFNLGEWMWNAPFSTWLSSSCPLAQFSGPSDRR